MSVAPYLDPKGQHRRDERRLMFMVRYRDASGRNRARVVGTKRDADAFDAKIKESRRRGELALLDAGRETLREYVCDTWSPVHAAHLAPSTRKLYAGLFDTHIAPYLGDVALRELTPETIARWQADRIASGAGPEPVRKALTLLGGMLQRAVEARRLTYNAARLVPKAAQAEKEEVRPLAPIDVERIAAALPERDAMFVLLPVTPACARRRRVRCAGDTSRSARWLCTRPRRAAIGPSRARCACSRRCAPTLPRGGCAAGDPATASS